MAPPLPKLEKKHSKRDDTVLGKRERDFEVQDQVSAEPEPVKSTKRGRRPLEDEKYFEESQKKIDKY